MKNQLREFSKTPDEACGFVFLRDGKLFATREENRAQNPKEFFQIGVVEFLNAKREAGFLGYWHSHPNGGPFSQTDKDAAEEIGVPIWLYGVPDDSLACYRPATMPIAPLIGRQFVAGVWDCVTFIRDWFKTECGIALPHFSYDENAFDHGMQIDIRELVKQAGGRFVSQFREGDILGMQTGSSKRPNHLAIVGPNNTILHQTVELSRADIFTDYWRRRTLWGIRL